MSMVAKYRDGETPPVDVRPDAAVDAALAEYRREMDALMLHRASEAAMGLVRHANAFVADTAPWAMAKEPGRAGELDATLNAMVRYVAVMAVLLFPFMPAKMEELWRRVAGERPMPLIGDLAA